LEIAVESESSVEDAVAVAIDDPRRLLQDSMRHALISRLAREIVVRSTGDAEAALAYAGSRPGERWIDPGDVKVWERLNTLFSEEEGVAFEPDQGRSAAEHLLRRLYRSRESLFHSIGMPGTIEVCGSRVRVLRARSEEDAWMQIDRAFRDREDRERWSFGPATHARRFRLPVRSLDEVARSAGSVRVAHAQFVVETESHATGLWESVWYWDGGSSAWQCLSMWKRGTDPFTLWY